DGRETVGELGQPVHLGAGLILARTGFDDDGACERRRDVLGQAGMRKCRQIGHPGIVEPAAVPQMQMGIDDRRWSAHGLTTPTVSSRFAYWRSSPVAMTTATSGSRAAA